MLRKRRALFVGLFPLLALSAVGCATRTSARFFQGSYNWLTRTPNGTLISVLNYCNENTPCKEPTLTASWGTNGSLDKLSIGYKKAGE